MRTRMALMMTNAHRQVQRFRVQDTTLYEIMVKRIEAQDQALGVMRQMWRTEYKLTDEQVAEVRKKAAEVVELSLRERVHRIEKLERALAEQKAKLEADQSNPEALIDEQARKMREEATDLIRRVVEFRTRNNLGMPQCAPPATSPSK